MAQGEVEPVAEDARLAPELEHALAEPPPLARRAAVVGRGHGRGDDVERWSAADARLGGGMASADASAVLTRVVLTASYVAVGYALQRFGALERADGEVMLRFVVNVTLPALLVPTLTPTGQKRQRCDQLWEH